MWLLDSNWHVITFYSSELSQPTSSNLTMWHTFTHAAEVLKLALAIKLLANFYFDSVLQQPTHTAGIEASTLTMSLTQHDANIF